MSKKDIRLSVPQRFVVLEGLKQRNRFYTTNVLGEDPTKLSNGTVAYRVLGYADTHEEALEIIVADPTDSSYHNGNNKERNDHEKKVPVE